MRICPVVTIGGADPSPQFNIEYRAADATANPYLVMTAVVLAGLEGLNGKLPCPPLVDDDPTEMTDQRSRRARPRALARATLPAALKAFDADAVVQSWFDPLFVESFHGVRKAELGYAGQPVARGSVRTLSDAVLMRAEAGPTDWPDAVEVLNEDGRSPFVLICEHASNHIPAEYDKLGLDEKELARHIAWDIGAAQVTRALSKRLDASAFLGGYSRLLIDLNRPLHVADSIPLRSEATDIPGNLSLGDAGEETARSGSCFFHSRIACERTWNGAAPMADGTCWSRSTASRPSISDSSACGMPACCSTRPRCWARH